MYDLISIGDARIDNVLTINDAHVLCSKDVQNCQICLSFGDKIPVEKFSHFIAGNNANNVVGASRLGLKTALFAMIGDDANGQSIVKYLKNENVDTKYVVLNKGKETEISTVVSFQGERTILVYHEGWNYHLPDLDKTKWVFFSSVSHSFSKTSLIPQIQNYVIRTGASLAFSPGTYQLKYGVKKMPQLLSLTKILFVNLEEAKEILDYKVEEKVPIKKLLTKLGELGPKMVVITDGKKGSFATDGEKFHKLGIFKSRLVEATGAGDAFASGTIAGLYYGEPLKNALLWGAANSSSVIEQLGPQSGLLDKESIEKRISENRNILVEEL